MVKDVTIRIYPPYNLKGQDWVVAADVYGDWAVHKPHKDETGMAKNYPWHITHLPTGALSFLAKRKGDALRAAVRLSNLGEAGSVVRPGGKGREPSVSSPSIEWIRAAAKALRGVQVWGVSNYRLVEINDLVAWAGYVDWESEADHD